MTYTLNFQTTGQLLRNGIDTELQGWACLFGRCPRDLVERLSLLRENFLRRMTAHNIPAAQVNQQSSALRQDTRRGLK